MEKGYLSVCPRQRWAALRKVLEKQYPYQKTNVWGYKKMGKQKKGKKPGSLKERVRRTKARS